MLIMEHNFPLITLKRGNGWILNLYLINLEHKEAVLIKIKNRYQPQSGVNTELHIFIYSAHIRFETSAGTYAL
jgi:hypothetical protein